MICRILGALLLASFASAAPILCEPGDTYFEDNFSDPGTVLDRWFFREHWTVRGGAIARTEIPGKNERVFIKQPTYRDCIVTLDFAFRGAEEIRVMTGSSGHYNAVVTIWQHGFRVFTAKDDSGPFLPTPHGECALELAEDEMHSLILEFSGDELVAQVGGQAIVAKHPILDRERSYFAFQVDRPSAVFDEVKIIRSEKRKPTWDAERERLLAIQEKRPWVSIEPTARRKDLEMITRDRLFRSDAKYRGLVDAVAAAKAAEKHAFPEVFKSVKERKKAISAERTRLLDQDPNYKSKRNAIHVARRAEDAYLKEKHPELAQLPSSQFDIELARRRSAAVTDTKFTALVAATKALETAFAKSYPQIHISDERLVAEGRAAREAAKNGSEFRALIKATSLAVCTEKNYVYAADPELKLLAPR